MSARVAESKACPWNVKALSLAPKVFEDPVSPII